MKFNFSSEIKFVPDWNGNKSLPADQQLSCTIKPMILGDMMQLMDAMGPTTTDGPQEVDENGNVKITGQQAMKIVAVAKDILPRYVTLQNLEDDDGPVGVEKIVTYVQYLPLATEVIMACINSSTPSAATEGNSPAPPG